MKTHCKHGHPRTPDNLTKQGACRTCNRGSLRRNRDKYNANKRASYAANPEKYQKFRDENRELLQARIRDSRYKLAPGQYDAMMTAQNNSCAVCHGPFGTGLFKPVVDHCHSTNVVRGILHNGCNTALGLIKESATVAEGLVKYIHTHRGQRGERTTETEARKS